MTNALLNAQITIFSNSGSTPITKRQGAYCDVLLKTDFPCNHPDEARAETARLIAATPHGARGHFYMPDHPNQNIRNGWV